MIPYNPDGAGQAMNAEEDEVVITGELGALTQLGGCGERSGA